jgi:DNA-binding CsgD family transcriptional regulator
MLTMREGVNPAAERAAMFAREALSASRSAFYRVDEDLSLTGFLLAGVPADFFRQYVAGMCDCDPLHARHARGRPVARLGDEFVRPASAEVATFQSFCAQFGIAESIEFFFRRNGRVFAGLNLAWDDARLIPENVIGLAEKMHDYIEFNLLSQIGAEPAKHRGLRYALTPREREVLDLLCCGRTNRDISECLDVSLATVKTHLAHIFEKLGVETRAAAVALDLRR